MIAVRVACRRRVVRGRTGPIVAAVVVGLLGPRAMAAEPAPSPMDLNNRAVEAAKAGRFTDAVDLLRQARAQAPADDLIRTNLAGILTDYAASLDERGRVADARRALEEAVQLDPTLWQALGRLGELCYVMDETPERAIAWWTQAYQHVPSDQRVPLASRISQAQRDMSIERSFKSLSTDHFLIRYDEAHAEQAAEVGTALEIAADRLTQIVGQAPPRVTVILYAGGDFQRIAGRRDWALGLYDGRIRLRIDEIQQHELAPAVLAHELGHAYLAETFGPGIPTWIHEGFAQLVEPPSPPTPEQQALVQALQARTAWVPLKWLDRRFTHPTHVDDVDRAYAESRYAVDQLVTRYGKDKWRSFLRTLQGGTPVDEAVGRVYGISWARLDQGSFE